METLALSVTTIIGGALAYLVRSYAHNTSRLVDAIIASNATNTTSFAALAAAFDRLGRGNAAAPRPPAGPWPGTEREA